MDYQKSPILNWTYLCQDKSMDEMKHSVLLTMELEQTKLKAQEELKFRDEQIIQLRDLLHTAIKERDEAQETCQKLFLEKLLLQQQLLQSSTIDDEFARKGKDSNNAFGSSESAESIISSPPPPPSAAEKELPIMIDRPLPEKGSLLQAVMKAGPLLQTLLLAGPLPRWRHPPPPLDTHQIPPPPVIIPIPQSPPPPHVLQTGSIISQDSFHLQNNININNCGKLNRKRVQLEGSDSSIEYKYQRVVHQ